MTSTLIISIVAIVILVLLESCPIINSMPYQDERYECCDDDKSKSSTSNIHELSPTNNNDDDVDSDDVANAWQNYDEIDCDDVTGEDISCPSSSSSSSSTEENKKTKPVYSATAIPYPPEAPADLLEYRSELRGFICLQIDVDATAVIDSNPSQQQQINQHDYLKCNYGRGELDLSDLDNDVIYRWLQKDKLNWVIDLIEQKLYALPRARRWQMHAFAGLFQQHEDYELFELLMNSLAVYSISKTREQFRYRRHFHYNSITAPSELLPKYDYQSIYQLIERKIAANPKHTNSHYYGGDNNKITDNASSLPSAFAALFGRDYCQHRDDRSYCFEVQNAIIAIIVILW